MAIKVQIQPVLKVLRRDPKYKTLLDTFKNHENFNLPLESLLDELKFMHKKRIIRKLNPTDPKFADNVIKAALDDQAKRSRITEIMVRCVRAHALLSSAVDSLRYHLLATYSEELRSFRTKEERAQVVNMVLKQFNSFLTNVSVVKESAQLIVADIDKSAWSLRLVVDTYKIHAAPETRL
jgi:hypothetical protein